MAANPKLSVIMSVYNGADYLEGSIDSILNQSFTDFEFIIIDDGSTDNSLDIISNYKDDRIKLIKNKENIGLTKSLNKAIDLCKGEYIARQDVDDISLPARLEKQVKYLDKHPKVALLGTSCYKIDDQGKTIGKMTNLSKPGFKQLLDRNLFAHGSVVYKKSVIKEIGAYNEFFRYAQDYELWLRIAKDYTVRNLKENLCMIRIHESTGFNKLEESQLYAFLARMVINRDLDDLQLKDIKKNGIKCLYPYLTYKQQLSIKKTIYKQSANLSIYNGDNKLAREYYKKVYRLDPMDFSNYIHFLTAFTRINDLNITTEIYRLYNKIKLNFIKFK